MVHYLCVKYVVVLNMAKKRITHHVPYKLKFHQIFVRLMLFLLCVKVFSSATSDHPFCNVLIHPGEYIRMRVNAKLNLSCDASSFERDPDEITPKGLQFWENMHQLENHDYKVVNTIITTILNVDAKINNTYTCRSNAPVRSRNMKEIVIGARPRAVKNFKCISHDFENWKCTFKAHERVPTVYVLAYKINHYIYNFLCVNTSSDNYVCETDLMRNTHEYYSFILTSKNCFGMRKENFTIRILKNVVPGGLLVNIKNVEPTTALIHWHIETNYPDYYLTGFVLEMKYRPKYTNVWEQGDKNKTKEATSNFYLTNLLPFNEYMVELRVKAADAPNSRDMFKYANMSFQTAPQRPDFPPVTDPGAFFVDNNQCVHFFWRAVPFFMMNGTNFRYQVRIRRESLIIREEKKIATANYFYKEEACGDGKYEFSVRSENSEGSSEEGEPIYVTVPKGEWRQEFPAPYDVKTIHNDSFYKLEWKMSTASSKFDLIDFTISTCASRVSISSLEFCEDAINFIHVNGTQRTFLHPYDLNKRLTFAISANYRNGSSGMILTHCIPHENSVLPRLEPKVQTFNESSITLEWALKCEERALVKGYTLKYCNADDRSDFCVNAATKITEINPNSTTYTLSGLRPFNNYILQIALLSSKRQGPFSLPLKQQTAEGAPSAPRMIMLTNITADSAELKWEKPELPNGIIRYYHIFLNGKYLKELENEWENKSYSYWLSNLESYQNHTVKVAAVTAWDSKKLVGKQSDSIDFRTRAGEPGIIEFPTVKLNGKEMQVSWHIPKFIGGPLKSLVYEVKWCRSDECQIKSTQRTNITMDYFCFDRERIKIYVRAIQEVSNVQHLNHITTQTEGDFYQNVTSENYLAQYGRWILASDIYCEFQVPLEYIVSFSILIFLAMIFLLILKIYSSMKNISLVVPQGLHDITEPTLRNPTLSDKSSEERYLLKKHTSMYSPKQNRVDLNGKSSLIQNISTLSTTGNIPMQGTINENESTVNFALKIQNNSVGKPFDGIKAEIYSSASSPFLNGNFATNTSAVCMSFKEAPEKDENMQKACTMIFNSQTGYVTMYLKGRRTDQEKNDMERVSIEILYSENSSNPTQRQLNEQHSVSDLSGYINRRKD